MVRLRASIVIVAVLIVAAFALITVLSRSRAPGRPARALTPLESRLLHDPNPDKRAAAAEALTGSAEASADVLSRALSDRSPKVRAYAAMALTQAPKLDSETIEWLISVFYHDPDRNVRWRTAEALAGKDDPRVTDMLLREMNDPNSVIFNYAPGYLRKKGDPKVVDALIAVLHAPFQGTKVKLTAEEIEEMRASTAMRGIPLRGSPTYKVVDNRLDVCMTLASTRSPKALAPLCELLASPDPHIRDCVASDLGTYGRPDAIPPLSRALNDPDWSVRASAASALGEIRSRDAVPVLIGALSDPRVNVATSAAQALGKIHDTRAVEPLIAALHRPVDRKSYDGQTFLYEAILALGAIGDSRAAPELKRLMRDRSYEVRFDAARSLAAMHDSSCINLLVKAAAGPNSPGRAYRWEAAEALADLDDPRVTKMLMGALHRRDMGVVVSAYRFYMRRGGKQAEGPLIEAMEKHGGGWPMARAFEKSGNERLAAAGRSYFERHPNERGLVRGPENP